MDNLVSEELKDGRCYLHAALLSMGRATDSIEYCIEIIGCFSGVLVRGAAGVRRGAAVWGRKIVCGFGDTYLGTRYSR